VAPIFLQNLFPCLGHLKLNDVSFQCVAHFLSENKVRELATLRLSWQHWTKDLVWSDDVDISAFHSCVVVDLWQSLTEWHLLLSACVLVRFREELELEQRTNIKFLVVS